jgi:hypothetical protein
VVLPAQAERLGRLEQAAQPPVGWTQQAQLPRLTAGLEAPRLAGAVRAAQRPRQVQMAARHRARQAWERSRGRTQGGLPPQQPEAWQQPAQPGAWPLWLGPTAEQLRFWVPGGAEGRSFAVPGVRAFLDAALARQNSNFQNWDFQDSGEPGPAGQHSVLRPEAEPGQEQPAGQATETVWTQRSRAASAWADAAPGQPAPGSWPVSRFATKLSRSGRRSPDRVRARKAEAARRWEGAVQRWQRLLPCAAG